jgi:YHS domain-containing protein
MRVLFDLIITIVVAMVARAIIGSLMKGFSNSARSGFGQPAAPSQAPPQPAQPKEPVVIAGELHKDPVCGMYVAESTRFQRKSGRDQFYYCSELCRDKHAVATR